MKFWLKPAIIIPIVNGSLKHVLRNIALVRTLLVTNITFIVILHSGFFVRRFFHTLTYLEHCN